MHSQTGELTYQKVTADNLQLALDVQHRIWPNEDVDEDYLSKPLYPEDASNVSWLIYHQGELVGLTGVFAFDPDEAGYDDGESIWMDWFAILPEFRRHYFGRQVLEDTIEYCRRLGTHKFFRIDTTYYPGRPAVSLYDQVMPLREEYTAEDTPDKKQNYLIYSCSLDGSPVKPWDNRFLDIGDNSEGDIIL